MGRHPMPEEEREKRFVAILQDLANGDPYESIAAKFGISRNTLREYLVRFYQITGTDNVRHLVAWAFRNHKVI